MPDPSPPALFDRRLYAVRRGRSAAGFSSHDFLHHRAMADIVERLETVTRDFPIAAFSGVGGAIDRLTPRCGVGDSVSVDLASRRLPPSGARVAGDEEALPFGAATLDLFVSVLTLHAVNDLVGALTQIRIALKPDGLFLGVLFGENTLASFKAALLRAEAALTGGASPRVAPFAAVRDLGGAVQRAGFAMPVADLDSVDVAYRSPMTLLADLRGMGETNVRIDRGRGLRRDVLAAAYQEFLSEGGIARFDLVTLTGWAPHKDQPQPLKPGSAKASLQGDIDRFR